MIVYAVFMKTEDDYPAVQYDAVFLDRPLLRRTLRELRAKYFEVWAVKVETGHTTWKYSETKEPF